MKQKMRRYKQNAKGESVTLASRREDKQGEEAEDKDEVCTHVNVKGAPHLQTDFAVLICVQVDCLIKNG